MHAWMQGRTTETLNMPVARLASQCPTLVVTGVHLHPDFFIILPSACFFRIGALQQLPQAFQCPNLYASCIKCDM